MELKDISPEDYDIEVALGKAKLPEDSIDLWFDTSDAMLIMSNLEAIREYRDSDRQAVLSITEESPVARLEREIATAKDRAYTIRLRALSDKEKEVTFKQALQASRIPKNASAEEKEQAQEARQDLVYEMMIAKATVEVLDRLQGVRTTALTHHQVANLRAKLPSPEWSRMREKFDEVQVLAYGYSLVMSDPSFRRRDASAAEEPEVPVIPEVSGE